MNNKDFQYQSFTEIEEKELDLVPLIKEYLKYWPLYVVTFLLTISFGVLYLMVSRPMYPVNMKILFLDQKDSKSSISSQVDGLDLMEIGGGISNVNTDNEIEIIKSREIILNTIIESRMYVDVISRSGLRSKTWYANTPFIISMNEFSLKSLKEPIHLSVSAIRDGAYQIEGLVDNAEIKGTLDQLPGSINTPYGVLSFDKNDKSKEQQLSKYNVTITPPLLLARYYSEKGGLSIERVEKNSSVAELSIRSYNKRKGEAFLDKLVEIYNRQRALDKDIVARKTYNFINERIAKIGSELTNTEVKLENVKRNEGVTAYDDLSTVVKSKVDIAKDKMEAETQLKLINYLISFISNDSNKTELIPNTMGVDDVSLGAAIRSYNELIFRRNKILEESDSSHPTLMALDAQLALARENILNATQAAKQGLEINLNSISRQEKDFADRIGNAPKFERISNDIIRQKDIRANLYLMLLKKREETSIKLASSAESAKVVDHALADSKQSSPKKSIILLACLLLGLIIPTVIIYLWKLTRTKISSEQDVKKITNIPILGHIPTHSFSSNNEIVVRSGKNDQMAEVFRSIRTNIDFITRGKTPAVILCTSTIPGEGKTFVASNISLSFATLDKKVLLVGMDIRNPQLRRTFGLSSYSKFGLSDILNDTKLDPNDYIITAETNKNLSILHSGTIPPNPSELLSRKRLDELIEMFKERYEYIVIDSAPVGPVVDTIVGSRIADMTLYVCRANFTEKSDFEFLNYLEREKKLPNISLVVNDINEKHTIYGKSYGYGYGKKKKTNKDSFKDKITFKSK